MPLSSLIKIPIVVDFPDPFGPNIPSVSLYFKLKLILFKAVSFLKCFVFYFNDIVIFEHISNLYY